MKTLVLTLLTVYHTVISPLLGQLLGMKRVCRFDVSCSQYSKAVIKKYGIIHGGKLTLIRLAHCQPLSKPYANL